MTEPEDPTSSSDPAAALFHVVDDTPEEDAAAATAHDDDATDRLNTVHIQRLATLRRATVRQHSWHLIAVAVTAMGAVELVHHAIVAARRGERLWCAAFAIAAIACAALAINLMRATIRLAREMRRAESPPATEAGPIDFAPLSNGSQLAQNLAAMQRQTPQPAYQQDVHPHN